MPSARMPRWVDNFAVRHGETGLHTGSGALHGTGADGSHFTLRPPFSRAHDGPATLEGLLDASVPPQVWGVLLVRKGGFAVARLEGPRAVETKVGQRHVQGRTKAGGQSQQRFARRRDNQARQAYEAAAGHAARILHGVREVVVGGDRGAVEEVLRDPRLGAVTPVGVWLAVPDPRRAVLDQAVLDAQAVVVEVVNA